MAIVWDVATGDQVCKLSGHLSPVSSLAFSPDGHRIVTGAWDRVSKLWDADTGRELLTLNGNGLQIKSVAFAPDGLRIVTGDWNKTARIREAARPEQVTTWEAEETAAAESRSRSRHELDALLREAKLK